MSPLAMIGWVVIGFRARRTGHPVTLLSEGAVAALSRLSCTLPLLAMSCRYSGHSADELGAEASPAAGAGEAIQIAPPTIRAVMTDLTNRERIQPPGLRPVPVVVNGLLQTIGE